MQLFPFLWPVHLTGKENTGNSLHETPLVNSHHEQNTMEGSEFLDDAIRMNDEDIQAETGEEQL